MKLFSSCECDNSVYIAYTRASNWLEPYLNEEFKKSSLVNLDCEIRFIPIVMRDEWRENYPARSKLRRKDKIWFCAPQLDYAIFAKDVFDNANFEPQLREYLREIALSGTQLVKLGATPEQIADFDRIMAAAVPDILAAKEKEAKDYRDSLREKN